MTKIKSKLILKRGNDCQRCIKLHRNIIYPVEQIHHKNLNVKDNRLSNLLLLCKSCHRAIHKNKRIRENYQYHKHYYYN